MNDWSARKRYVEVLGRRMAYVEAGEGIPIVFQHGNPTSSYLWRNILPQLAGQGRCIALDLIGMGDSDKLPGEGPGRYGLAVHQQFFDGALTALGVTGPVVLVLHDWGSALGFDWARRHASAVRGLAYMEGLIRSIGWDDWPEAARGIFQAFRSPATGGQPFGTRFVRGAGYNEWADDNRLIVLYPQVLPLDTGHPEEPHLYNPKGCWDFWGYTQRHGAALGGQGVRFEHATRSAPQIEAVWRMVQALSAQP